MQLDTLAVEIHDKNVCRLVGRKPTMSYNSIDLSRLFLTFRQLVRYYNRMNIEQKSHNILDFLTKKKTDKTGVVDKNGYSYNYVLWQVGRFHKSGEYTLTALRKRVKVSILNSNPLMLIAHPAMF